MEKGVVKWFNGSKGYGFISREDGTDVFVHYTAIESNGEYRTLNEGEQVEFEVTESPKGLQAVSVKKVWYIPKSKIKPRFFMPGFVYFANDGAANLFFPAKRNFSLKWTSKYEKKLLDKYIFQYKFILL